MKAADIMQRQIVTVTSTTKLREVGKIIFGLQIAGVPVVKGKKLLGLITQTDILRKLYPTYQEFMEDYVHASNFEIMEQIGDKILDLPAGEIMNKHVTTVLPNAPVMRVQGYMLAKGFGRVPVVDENNNLLGIISQGDIFRAVVGQKLPLEEEESFYDWVARHYDVINNWKERLGKELPSLVKLFRKERIKKVLDIGSSTGEHAMALAKKDFEVVGIESSSLMGKFAKKKKENLPDSHKKRIAFFAGEYKTMIKELPNDFNAAIFMGNALPHVIYTDKQVLQRVVNKLDPVRGILFFQIANFDKTFRNGGLRDFTIRSTPMGYDEQHLFFTFYKKGKGNLLTYNLAIFDFISGKWVFRGINSTPIIYLDKKEITKILRSLGFTKISYYGSMLSGPSIEVSFNPSEHDWLNVVAKR